MNYTVFYSCTLEDFVVKLKPFTILYYSPNLYAALYGRMKFKFHVAEAIVITLLLLNFSHFNIHIFVQKNSTYQNI